MDFLNYAESVLQSTEESYIGIAMNLRFDIIDFIKKLLKENYMTQGDLALKMKMKDSQLTRIINAESNITLNTVARIYHAFGCAPTIREKHEHAEVVSDDSVYNNQANLSQTTSYRIINIK